MIIGQGRGGLGILFTLANINTKADNDQEESSKNKTENKEHQKIGTFLDDAFSLANFTTSGTEACRGGPERSCLLYPNAPQTNKTYTEEN